MTTFVDSLDDSVTLGSGPNGPGLSGMLVTFGVTLSDTATLHDVYGGFGWGLSLQDGVALSVPLFEWTFIAGRIISEKVAFSDAAHAQLSYQVTLSQKVGFKDKFVFSIPVTLADTIGIQGILQVAYGVTVIQKILLGDNPVPSLSYTQTIVDRLLLNQELMIFFGIEPPKQNFTITDSFVASFSFGKSLSDTVEIISGLSTNLVWQVTYPEGAVFDDGDEAFASMIYGLTGDGSTLSDGIILSAGWLDPSGGWTTWSINTRTQAVTEYQGWGVANGQQYGFNSIVKLGGHYIGANSQGIWQLDGKTDNGANVSARMKSGILNLGNDHYTMLDSGIYLGLRVQDNSKEWILKLHTNKGEYIYRFRPKNMESTKITVGKGFRHRYFAWELITPGPDFDLDAITFLPLISKRRSN